MTTFSEGIVGKIKQEHIAPVPRWHYLLKSYLFWFFLGFSLLLGSFSFSVIAHLVEIGDFDLLRYSQKNEFTSTVMLLPYIWALSLLVSTLLAYFNWKQTRFRYRFRRRWILIFSVVVSMILGAILYALGMGKVVDKIMAKSMPFYDQSKHKAREEIWLRPESGLIMGKVLNMDSLNNQFVIQDGQGVDWHIDEKSVATSVVKTIKTGKIVKIIGRKEGENKFIAREIRRCGDCEDDEDDDGSDDDDKDNEEAEINERMEDQVDSKNYGDDDDEKNMKERD